MYLSQLEQFIGTVCVGSTGRLGIVTHVEQVLGPKGNVFRCAGFGLDGKGVWTSTRPTIIADAEDFYNTLVDRFGGKLSYHG